MANPMSQSNQVESGMVKAVLTAFLTIVLSVSVGWLAPDQAAAAVAYNAASESHTGTTGSTNELAFTWSHSGAATTRGVVVFVYTMSATDNVTSVTYGGAPMIRVAGGAAVDNANEVGRVDTFFLGASVPAGTQSVVVNRTNSATIMYAVAMTVTAASDTGTAGIILLQQDGAYAVQPVNDGSPGVDSLRFAGGYYGGNSPAPAGTGSTLSASIDLGSYGASAVYETTAGQGARNIGFNNATTDDRAAVHLAVIEVADITPPAVNSILNVNATPTNATSVQYTVAFSESVTGVEASDFALTTTGVTAASVTGVSGSGASYTVTVNTGSGDGTIRLDLADDDTIADAAGNRLGGTGAGNGNFTAGAVYTLDKTAPILSTVHIASNNADPAKALVGDTVTLTFTAAESITSPTVTIAGNGSTVTGGPTVWSASHTVLVTDPTGPVTFSIASFNDSVGNIGSQVATVTDASSVTVTGANLTLTLTTAGAGSGTIISVPGNIACTRDNNVESGTCSDDTFVNPTDVTLTAAPDWKTEVSWTGGCVATGNTCGPFTLTSDAGVTATFSHKQSVMMPGPAYYATIQDAYNAASGGTLIMRNQTFNEDLVLAQAIDVTLDGGYDQAWSKSGSTTVHGTLTLVAGVATISEFIIE